MMFKTTVEKLIAMLRSWIAKARKLHLLAKTKSFLKLPLNEKKKSVSNFLKAIKQKALKAWEFVSVKILFGSENETPQEKIKRSMLGKLLLSGVAIVLTGVMVFAMTAAWHTNVIQSTGLVFNVTEWGMDENVNLKNQLANIAPGEKGALDVEVYNSSEGLIDVSFNISKVPLYNDIADMRKRVYFYVEDTVVRNEETVNKVYFNSAEEYSYTLLAKQKLFLNENSASPLMWEWVYDVLGYYFNGTVTADSASVNEYLRPIVYDFESATFKDDKLQTVDGTTSLSSFLNKITATDGYAGKYGAAKTTSDGKVYYPVSVDENGSGVWIYLCTLSEIEYESVVDTNLGNTSAEAKRQFNTNLHILAEQKKLNSVTVSSEEELRTALTDDTHNMVVLSSDIEIHEEIDITNGKQKIINLSENTITTNLTGTIMAMKEGSSLSMMNGTIVGNESHTGALITAEGSMVALSGITISDVGDAIWVADQTAKNTDTVMNIIDCSISCSDSGVFIKGNGSVTNAYTYLNIENTDIVSTGDYGIVGNGSVLAAGNFGTNITVKNSSIKATYAGIYHPQKESKLLVESTKIEGITPLVVKGGFITVIDSTVEALKIDNPESIIQLPKFEGNGFSDVGAALYVETGYDYPTTVTIGGESSFTSHHQNAVLVYDSNNSKYKVEITGGSFSHDVSAFTAKDYSCAEKDGRFVVSKNQ